MSEEELPCGMGGACEWRPSASGGGLVCDKCLRVYADRFVDRVAYQETKVRVAHALANSPHVDLASVERGARDAIDEWARQKQGGRERQQR